MLVSHKYKFIFIKTHKTAGSRLEAYLLPFCKEDGIIDTRKFQSHRPAYSAKEMVGEAVWNSYTKICPVRNPWDKMVSLYFWRTRKRPFYYHLLRLIRGKHPRPLEQRVSFEELIIRKKQRNNLDKRIMFISEDWEDYFFIRYEHLHEDLELLCQNIGIPYDPNKLPQKKVGYRDGKDYRKYYNETTRKIVADAFKEEIEKFDYSF